jgi:hypothetical protein
MDWGLAIDWRFGKTSDYTRKTVEEDPAFATAVSSA